MDLVQKAVFYFLVVKFSTDVVLFYSLENNGLLMTLKLQRCWIGQAKDCGGSRITGRT